MVSSGDPEYLNGRHPLEVLFEAQMYVHQVAGMLAAERREHPGDDLFSSLVNAEVDGDRLTDADIAAFFVLLTVAGNDTTRQTTSHGLKALTDFPDQRAWLLEDFDNRIGGAVEEFIRWATPVMTFRRTAATDFEIARPSHPRRGEGGDVLFVRQLGHRGVRASGAVGSEPKPQPASSASVAAACTSAWAPMWRRAQLRAIFGELLHQLPDIQAGEPVYVAGNFIHGIRSMPCTLI